MRQGNYNYDPTLTKEELNEKKKRLIIPDGPYKFDNDIIEDAMAYENSLVFNEYKDHHDKDCKIEKCC